jgi:hypothetical protein
VSHLLQDSRETEDKTHRYLKWLTNTAEQSPVEKVVVRQLIKKFLANYGTGNLLFTASFSTNSGSLYTHTSFYFKL